VVVSHQALSVPAGKALKRGEVCREKRGRGGKRYLEPGKGDQKAVLAKRGFTSARKKRG